VCFCIGCSGLGKACVGTRGPIRTRRELRSPGLGLWDLLVIAAPAKLESTHRATISQNAVQVTAFELIVASE